MIMKTVQRSKVINKIKDSLLQAVPPVSLRLLQYVPRRVVHAITGLKMVSSFTG